MDLVFIARWFGSKTVRQATDFCRQAKRIVNEQRDLLKPEAVQMMNGAIAHLREGLRTENKTELQSRMTSLEQAASKWLRPYPNPGIRDNVKELLVAVTVILSFTTFFLQLTKIPTGSLQPTLFGITYTNLISRPDAVIPGRMQRILDYWIKGIQYFHVEAQAEGYLVVQPPRRVFPFIKKQTLVIGGKSHTMWFVNDELTARAGLHSGMQFRKGVAGDHLFVDRITYNFRKPERGEIIVFKTKGIEPLPQNQLYIKRLVALGGERVRIGDDQRLIINDRRLDASTPRFENVYTFDPTQRPENSYFGHANARVGRKFGSDHVAPLFPDERAEFLVPENGYLAMGDNTLNSSDSRSWGAVPEQNVIGKAWLVYWPITERFGFGYR
jgi:signal peptidase I